VKSRVLFLTAWRSLAKNRMRSFLTLLGIIIGVAAVIVMVAIGRGAQLRVESQISAMGKNLLTVFSGNSQSGGVSRGSGSINTLTFQDADKLREEATTLAAVSPVLRTNAQAIAGGTNWQTTIYGVSPEYLEIRGWQIADGETFSDRDVRARARVALLGKTVADTLFGDASPVGAQIRLGSVPYTVVGVLAPKGQTGFGQDQDDTILAPVTSVQASLAGGRNAQQIVLSFTDGVESDVAQAEVEEVLRRAHRLADNEDDDFSIRSQSEIAATAAATTQTFTLLLGAIAGVSLLVGGIGIMNILLVSVTERTREIGIRLAVGAKSRDVLAQFLIEAVVVSFAGGAVGALLAITLAEILRRFSPMQTVVEPNIVLLALAVSAAIGIFFGFQPARRAANLDPIEALRYE
jgi:putative ABC transport system permease protein